MNILAIGTHPDNVETSCGGTLSKFARQSHKVFTATATLSMNKTAAIRKSEAKKAVEVTGTEYFCLDYDDEMFFADRTIARYRGIQYSVQCAQGFRMANDAFRVAPFLILP